MRRSLVLSLFLPLALALGGCGMYGGSSSGGSAPSITGISPSTGPVGTSVTISGKNFGSSQGYSTITFGGTTASPTNWSATSIVAPVPAGATTGSVVVTVGGTASNGMTFTVSASAPSITSLNPTSGAVGTPVTITGTNFGASQGNSTVKFNGTAATPTNWSATSITAPVPTGATTGSVVVSVGGVASNGVNFTVSSTAPSITSLNPTSGPVGTSVTITGTNFGSTQGTSTVKFNGTTATPTAWGATSIAAPVPSGATTGNVVVTVGGVASNGVSFTVTSSTAPSITSLIPTSGPVGTPVTITGTNFGSTQGTSTVAFNGTTATPTAWGATSITAPVPTGATTGSVVVTVGGVASNGVNFTVPTGSVAWPIKGNSNGRYLVDQNNTPFYMMADAGHHLVCNLAQSGWPTYLSNRQSKGYNATDVFAPFAGSNCANGGNGSAFDGTLPFTTGTSPSTFDLSTPNNAFWAEVDTLINQAASDGLVVILNPLDTQQFLVTMQSNGAAKCFNFGAYLGTRYKGFTNLIWHHGVDFNTYTTVSDMDLVTNLMAGIASTDPNHLQTLQLAYPRSWSNQAQSVGSSPTVAAAGLDFDFVYSYNETYDYVLQAYNSSPTLPVWLGEANYEGGNNTGALPSGATPFVLREQSYWSLTSGAIGGQEWGNASVDHIDSSYPGSLSSPGSAEVVYVLNLIAPFQWWNLVPDSSHQVVTAGYGTANPSNQNLTTATYATTAYIPSGSLATLSITYTPVATNALSVNMAMFTKSMNASWYDPTTGTSTTISGSPFANSGSQTFTPSSTAHADGSHDWILVLQ